MLREEILAHLAALKLKGMLAAYDEIVAAGLKKRSTPEKILHELLTAEAAEREASSIRYRLGQARFPVSKDLDSFAWSALAREEPRRRGPRGSAAAAARRCPRRAPKARSPAGTTGSPRGRRDTATRS